MIQYLTNFLYALSKNLDDWKGKRDLRILAINNNASESYRITTNEGGLILIYCTETIYEIVYDSKWVRNKKHYSYKVFGECNKYIPKEFTDLIVKGFHISRLLPRISSRQEQKKAAIHAYVSLLVKDLEKQDYTTKSFQIF